MKTCKSHSSIRLVISSVIGASTPYFSRIPNAKILKKKIHNTTSKITNGTKGIVKIATYNILNVNNHTVNKVTDITIDIIKKMRPPKIKYM